MNWTLQVDRIHSSLPQGIQLSLETFKMPIHRGERVLVFEVKERKHLTSEWFLPVP